MINLTDRIKIVQHENLSDKIHAAITATSSHLISRYGAPPAKLKWDSRHAIHRLFSDYRIKSGAQFDEPFLQAALDFNATSSRNELSSKFFNKLEDYLDDPHPPATALASIKQGIKLILVELWSQSVILLPSVFSYSTHFEPIPFRNEVYEFLKGYAPNKLHEPQLPKGRISEARRMFYYMPKVLLATSWNNIEDVQLQELAALQRAQRLFMTGQSENSITTSPVPWSLFINKLFSAFPNRTSYDQNDIKRYAEWLHSGTLADISFNDFESTKKIAVKRKVEPKSSPTNPTKNTSEEKFKDLGSNPSHAAALRYFEEYKQRVRGGIDWLDRAPVYPGREHANIESSTHGWRVAFRAFLHHRAHVKGYESDEGAIASLNIFADYIFLYLPWWKELFPESRIEIPLAPKDFRRYAFIYRSTGEDISVLPVTFPEMVKLRRGTKESQYAALKQIQLFFKFVEAHFSEDSEIAGPSFRTPLFDEFDMPRAKKRGKTSKIVFPKNSYGHLVYYGYALEAFGQFLLERSLAEEFSQEHLRALTTCRIIDTAEFGYVPYVQYRGTLTPLTVVPNVFTWATRHVQLSATESRDVLIPHLTTFRVLHAAVEVGLRLSALRWLDRRTWDKDNLGCPDISTFSFRPSDQYVYGFHVSSDKKKEYAWETSVVFRVRSLLLREQQFQLSIKEPGMNDEVPYKNRPLSRFGNILPLFRSTSSANPISENLYQDLWVLYMVGFQDFFARAIGTFVPFVKIQPTSSTTDNPKIVCNDEGIQYCPVSILAVSTPHACRASFATNRQGILETSEIAELIGHEDPNVTEYYQSPRAEDLKKKLELSDLALHADHRRFDKEDSAYIRPDKEESALVRNFKADRNGTMATFGFMPPMSLWKLAESENMDEIALEALRNGPMSLIRFRETHICPVGEECPSDIVEAIGGFKKCGLCPLALKCIDHLPAIAAKKNLLTERIKYLSRQKEQMETVGETAAVEAIWEEMDLETNELLGWQLSEEILTKMHAEHVGDNERDVVYHAERPDIVRRHLQRVVKKTRATEFLLQRIAEANAYPSLQSPQVQAVAVSIRRRLLAGRMVSELMSEIPSPGDVSIAAKMLKTVMQANQLTVSEISAQLNDESVALPSKAPLRIGASS